MEDPGENPPWEPPPPSEPPPPPPPAPYLDEDPFPDDPDIFEADPDVPVDESTYPRIVDGDECNRGTTVYLNNSHGVCSGVLIAPDLVLTAAHCLKNADGVVLAEDNRVGRGPTACETPESRGIAMMIHGRYRENGGVQYDVAVIKLATPIENATVATVGSRAVRGTRVTLNGYGNTAPNTGYGTQRCSESKSVGTTGNMTEIAWGSGLCGGDSGGPLFRSGTSTVVGIMARADDDCRGTALATILPRAWLTAAITALNNMPVTCTNGDTQWCRPNNAPCIPIEPGAMPKGVCKEGLRTCRDGRWGSCEGYVLASAEVCIDVVDNDCDGTVNEDCPDLCNNGVCDAGEDSASCAADCPRCTDGICHPSEVGWCDTDCPPAGDSCICGWDCPPNTPGCGYCGDGQCNLVSENSTSCPQDCTVCGDGYCHPYFENAAECALDCYDGGGGGSCICGWDCPANTPGCGYCGDGNCDVASEHCGNCPNDCGACGGGGGGGDPGYGGCGYDDYWWWYDWYGPEIAADQCGMLAY